MIGSVSVLMRAGLVAAFLGAGGIAMAADEPAPAVPSASMTVHPAASAGAATAQDGIGAGPLQGPLGTPGLPGSACCPCRTVRHVVHHVRHRVLRTPPVTVARAYVPLVPLRPVYVYRPVVAYRPLVPVFAYRPFFYRPYYYRPYYYRPYVY